jgi:hypothetical protein
MSWSLIWGIWAALFAASFVALETWALVRPYRMDTLSENIRTWLGIWPSRPVRRVAVPMFAVTLIAFTVWFVPHIVWQL